MRQRRYGSRSVAAPPRLPRPEDKRLFFVMFEKARAVQVVVLRAVFDCPADRRARERLIVEVLPFHRQWCQMPVVPARNSSAVGVRCLMTRGAIQAGHAFALGTADHIRKVAVSIVALLRIIRQRTP